MVPGVVLLGVGAALAATGIVFLLRAPAGATAAVALSPDGLLLSGSF